MQLDTIQQTFEVNLYGALRVTQAFLLLVQQAPAGRIVNVSSTLGSLTTLVSPGSPLAQFPFFAYPASKTVLNALTAWLAVELAGTPVKLNSACPGSNSTDMNPNPTRSIPPKAPRSSCAQPPSTRTAPPAASSTRTAPSAGDPEPQPSAADDPAM